MTSKNNTLCQSNTKADSGTSVQWCCTCHPEFAELKTGGIPIITHFSSPTKSAKMSPLSGDSALQQLWDDTSLMSGGCRRKSKHICVSINVCDPNSLLPFISRLHRYLSGPAPRLSAYPHPEPRAPQEQRRVCRSCRTASHCQLPPL